MKLIYLSVHSLTLFTLSLISKEDSKGNLSSIETEVNRLHPIISSRTCQIYSSLDKVDKDDKFLFCVKIVKLLLMFNITEVIIGYYSNSVELFMLKYMSKRIINTSHRALFRIELQIVFRCRTPDVGAVIHIPSYMGLIEHQ